MKDLTTVLAAVKREMTAQEALYSKLKKLPPDQWVEMFLNEVDELSEAMGYADDEYVWNCAIQTAAIAVCLAENAEDLFAPDEDGQ